MADHGKHKEENRFSEQLSGEFNVDEFAIIKKVAKEYKLNEKESKLLWSIRQAEQGRVGREFGVLVPEAMRFEDSPVNSFMTQARWAAGTIKKRYKGDIKAFGGRWAPVGAENDPNNLNKNWIPNIEFFMNQSPNFGGK